MINQISKGYKGFQTLIWEDDKFIQDGTKKAFSVDNYKKLGSFKHSITKHKITAEVYLKESRKNSSFEYMKMDEASSTLTASLDLKALKLYENLSKRIIKTLKNLIIDTACKENLYKPYLFYRPEIY